MAPVTSLKGYKEIWTFLGSCEISPCRDIKYLYEIDVLVITLMDLAVRLADITYGQVST